MQPHEGGYQRLIAYVQDRINDYLRKKGKYREAGEDVWVVYARKSRKEKDKQERSIPDQLSDLMGWATAQGVKPVKIFQENESAKVSGKRPLFNEMVEGIKKGKWNAILSWHPNRLARNMLEAGMIIDLLDSGKITNLHFHNYYFGGEPNDIMALGINFVLAKQYSDNLSQVSTRGTNKIVAEGKAPTRKPKYGYMLNRSNRYRPDIHNGKNNFKLIQNAFKMARMGEPLVKIVDYLKQEQFEYDGKICNVTKQKVSQILSDPIYAGIFLYGNVFTELNLVDAGFVPAVTPDVFMQLRALMDKKYSFKPTSRTKAILFSKMVYCGYCCNLMTPGKPLSANKKTRYYELRCVNQNCPTHLTKEHPAGVRGKVLFEFILELLKRNKLTFKKNAYELYLTECQKNVDQLIADLRREKPGLTMQITETEKELEQNKNALAKAQGSKTIEEINTRIDELRTALEGFITRRQELDTKEDELRAFNTSAAMSHEDFLNFFENLGAIIQNSDNVYLVDKAIRTLFLNFTVKDKKVVDYQLNYDVATLLNDDVVLIGRGDRT